MKYLVFALLIIATDVSAQDYKLVLPTGHHSSIGVVKFSPDGKLIVSADNDGVIKLWDATTGRLLSDLAHGDRVSGLDFSPDGNFLISAGGNEEIKIWNVRTATLSSTLKGEISSFNAAEFSPDGKRILGVTGSGKIYVFDLLTHSLLWKNESTYPGGSSSEAFAHFTPDGKNIYANGLDSNIAVWNASDGDLLFQLPERPKMDPFNKAVISPDGSMIFRWSKAEGFGEMYSLDSQKVVYKIEANFHFVGNDVAFSSDSKNFFIAQSGTVWIYDVSNGKFNGYVSGTFSGYSKGIDKLLVSAKTGLKLAAKKQGDYEYEIPTKLPVHKYTSPVFDAKGERIALYTNSNIEIYNVYNPVDPVVLQGHTTEIETITAFPANNKILVVPKNARPRLWDYKTVEVERFIAIENIKSCMFSPDGKYMAAYTSDKNYVSSINIYRTADHKLVAAYPHGKDVYAFSPDSKFFIIVTGPEYSVEAWDLNREEGNIIIPGNRNEITSLDFNPVTNTLLLVHGRYGDAAINIIDRTNYRTLVTIKGDDPEGLNAVFSPDGKYIAVTRMYGHEMKLWDASTGRLVRTISDGENIIYKAYFSPDGSRLLSLTHHGYTPKIWDVSTGKLLAELSGLESETDGFFLDDSIVLTKSRDDVIRTWNAFTGRTLRKYELGKIHRIIQDPERKSGLIAEGPNGLIFLNVNKESPDYSLIFIDSTDHLAKTAEGYYKNSKNASKYLHYVTPSLDIITFQQLDVRYNRPDKLLEAAGNHDSTLTGSYRNAYVKRLKKLGIDSVFSDKTLGLPFCDFERGGIGYEQLYPELELVISAKDSSYILDRFNIWINEVPVFGSKGLSIRALNSKFLDTAITIQLSQGKNVIETTVTNSNGIESYRRPLEVNYVPDDTIRARLHFIGIGLDKFRDNKRDLNYSVKDIRDLAVKLKEKYGDRLTIDTLFNAGVTVSSVKAFKEKLLKTSVDDKVIISYSGHGVLSKDFDYYLSTYDMDFSSPENAGLPYETLEWLIDSIPSRNKLMLIDACHSGEVDKEEMQKYKLVLSGEKKTGLKGGELEISDSSRLGLKNSFDLMQELFVNVGKSTGATIISAAAGTQLARESSELKNGVFTYSILEFMKQHPTATVSELKEYVNNRVPELSRNLQKPTTRSEVIAVNWKVW